MKLRVLVLMAGVLTACAPAQTKKNDGIPPLSAIVPLIKAGMNVTEVTKSLSGHKPFLQYTYHDNAIWEVVERNSDPNTNTMNANRLSIQFGHDGKVSESASTFCFLPDMEPMLGKSPETRCYQKQVYPFEKKLTYDAIKRLLIISNYQVDHSDAASEIISATGMHGIEGDKDQMMFIKLSIIFSAQATSTEVVMSATFSMSEKQSTWVQAGFGGVTLPVPLPFQRTEEWVDSGIVTPKFYLEFYDALSKLIAREYLPYTPLTITDPAKSLNPSPVTISNKPLDYSRPKEAPKPNNTIKSIDAELSDLEGPIDGSPKAQKTSDLKESPAQDDAPEEFGQDSDIFSELHGRPIDSGKLKK